VLIKLLIDKGYKNIIAYDPLSIKSFDKTYKLPIKYSKSLNETISKANIIVLATAWQEFLDNKHLFKDKKVFDLRYKL